MKQVLKTLVVVMTMVFGVLGIAFADLNDGLVAYYPFNDNANDESGNGNDGTGYGGVSYFDGVIGQAASFDGVDDYIDISDSDSLDTGTHFTVAAWFMSDDVWKIDPATDRPIQTIVMYGWHPANGKNNVLQIRDGKLKLTIRGYGGGYEDLVGITTVESDTWYHAALTYDGTTATLYLNGAVEVSQTATMNLNKVSRVLIGRYQNPKYFNIAGYFDGLIDDVRIYNRALSESEIQQLYPKLTIRPMSGKLVTTHTSDVTLIIEAPDITATVTNVTRNDIDITEDFNNCAILGALISGGQTFRRPNLNLITELVTGKNTFSVTIDLSNGVQVSDNVTWDVLANTEP